MSELQKPLLFRVVFFAGANNVSLNQHPNIRIPTTNPILQADLIGSIFGPCKEIEDLPKPRCSL